MFHSLKPERYFIRDVEQIIRRNRQTLRRMWCRGAFPEPSGQLNNRLFWKADVIDQWINNN